MTSALVLGGSGGIGAAVCRRLAAEHAVAVGFHHDAVRADAVVGAIRAAGGRADAAAGNATTAGGIDAAFAVAEALGELRVVVHCVGNWNYTRLTDIDEQDLDRAYTVNLRSAVLALAAAGRRLPDGAQVVMVSSAAAHVAPARQATYAAMKAGVEAASRVAAKELGQRGISVNVVRPGATDTEQLRGGTSPRAVEAMSQANSRRRLGTPEEVAGAITLLCATDATWVTGAVLSADGWLY